jgi:hypothetical protein
MAITFKSLLTRRHSLANVENGNFTPQTQGMINKVLMIIFALNNLLKSKITACDVLLLLLELIIISLSAFSAPHVLKCWNRRSANVVSDKKVEKKLLYL